MIFRVFDMCRRSHRVRYDERKMARITPSHFRSNQKSDSSVMPAQAMSETVNRTSNIGGIIELRPIDITGTVAIGICYAGRHCGCRKAIYHEIALRLGWN